jgi:hypothetical protein
MNIKKETIYILFIIFLLFSCETIVNVNLPKHNPKIVVNSINSPEFPWVVDLSLSKGILESGDIKMLSGAKVGIYENGESIALLKEIKNGLYAAVDKMPKVGIDYQLKVSAKGFKPVSADCHIPKVVTINDVTTNVLQSDERKELEFIISFADPPKTDNYYSFSVYANGYAVYFSSNDLVFQDEENSFEFSGRRFSGYKAIFDDSVLKGCTYSLKIYIDLDNKGNKYEIVLSSLSKEYYLYLITRRTQAENEDNPFAEPVMVFNNINGGFGIFTGYNVSKYIVLY